ncbi:MAG: mandelate racemase/muconate lactonizing enzyme family protein [Halobacteriales archaeon]
MPITDAEITDVQATHVHADWTWTFVRLYTDAGVTGTGEAYWGPGVADVVEDARSRLVGEDPTDVDRLRRSLFEGFSATGSLAGTTVTAISGLDIAIHDLAGKLLEVPASQLLGGRYRDAARVYVDCHAGEHAGNADDADEDVYSADAYADAAEAVLAEGFDVLKFDLDASTRHEMDEHNRHLNAEAIEYKAGLVEAVTDRVGHAADVAFDCHWNYTGDSAIRLGSAIEDCDVWWLEDVVPPENLDVQREVTRATDTPICTGENVYRTHGVRPLIEEAGIDVLQPDMPKFGGMRETVRAAQAADDYYIPLALHNVSSPLGTVAGAHVAAAAPNFLAIEWHARDDPRWGDFVEEDGIIQDGAIPVPEEPGLGVTLDLDTVAEFAAPGEDVLAAA